MPHNTLLVVSTVTDEEPDEDVRDRVAKILGSEYTVFLGTEEAA
jgi:hypothetical protein